VPDDGVPNGRRISRTALADQVKDRLLEQILAGHYPPNSRIVETRVARELGLSQAPVREALRSLEGLGLIEISPFRGARIRHPSTSELLEAYVVRSELESLGARLAVPQLTDADLADLAALGEEMQRAAREGDRHAVAVADASFHARLVHAARNATLERVWRALEPFSRTYITLAVPGLDVQWTADLHLPILDALRWRDAEMVVRALRQHFDEVGARLAAERSEDAPGSAEHLRADVEAALPEAESLH
jgi:DNA-binding GntR family transcriptional regulator